MYMSFPYVAASLQARFAIGSATSGLMLMLFGVGGLFFISLAGLVVARTRETTRCVAGGVLLSASYALLAGSVSVVLSTIALIGMGMGFFMLHNLLQVAATRMAPEARGSAVAAFAAVFFLAQAIGTPFGGFIFDRFGPATLFLLSAIALLALGVILARHGSATDAARRPRFDGRSSPPRAE